MDNDFEKNKIRFSLWINPDVLSTAKMNMHEDNCGKISEYIEKAVIFYNGFLSAEKNKDYLSKAVIRSVKSILNNSQDQMNRQLFRVAVELSMVKNILAAVYHVPDEQILELKQQCVAEVKRINDVLSFEEAQKWQNS